ncbi:hypothetical protein D3C71_2228340 [compost metagenome]
MVQAYLDSGVFERVPQAPEFTYPTYLVYARERDSQALQQAISVLQQVVASESDWSQRWDPVI